MKTKLTPIQRAISSMMKENTGRHMLDSGGAYGRNFERNAEINFLDTPHFVDNTDKYGINFTYNIFWYLTRFLDITDASKKLNARFQHYYKKRCQDSYDPEIMQDFVEDLMKTSKYIKILSGDVTNTYNYENILSQVLQYTGFENEETGEFFIILQTHNGFDVRGGYSDPKIFEVTNYDTCRSESWNNFHSAQTDCQASDGENTWDSYNSGYSFEPSGNNDEPEFKKIVILLETGAYNKLNGKRIAFGNYLNISAGEGEIMPEINDIRNFVQENYLKPDLEDLVKKRVRKF